MTRLFSLRMLPILVFCALLTGCGKKDGDKNKDEDTSDPESLFKEQIKVMNDLADAYKKNDGDKVKELTAKHKDLQDRFKGKVSKEENKKLMEKYGKEFSAALGKMTGAQVNSKIKS